MTMLKLDWDTGKWWKIKAVWWALKVKDYLVSNTLFRVRAWKIRETGRGFHIVADARVINLQTWDWEDIVPAQLVFFQAKLGSDIKRECNNLERIENGHGEWNRLFEEKVVYRREGKTLRRVAANVERYTPLCRFIEVVLRY